MVGRHANDRSGLQALLRAGRVRDGVDRIPADAGDHVSRQRRGRAHRGALAEGERRRARARIRSHLPVGHVGGRASGGGCRAGAAGHVRRRRQPESDERGALRARRLRADPVRSHGCPDRAGARHLAATRRHHQHGGGRGGRGAGGAPAGGARGGPGGRRPRASRRSSVAGVEAARRRRSDRSGSRARGQPDHLRRPQMRRRS